MSSTDYVLSRLQLDPTVRSTSDHFFLRSLKSLVGLKSLRKIYTQFQSVSKNKLPADAAVDVLGLRLVVAEQQLERIPKDGPTVVVANHPFGGSEGVVLASLIQRVRKDVKILINHHFATIPEFADLFLSVDPEGGRQAVKRNIVTMRSAYKWLKQGGVLVVFPAGKVSTVKFPSGRIADKRWNLKVARMIKYVDANVVPVFFAGRHPLWFYLVGVVHTLPRTLLLPRFLLKQKGRRLKLQIGHTIKSSVISQFATAKQLIRYLRFRCYALRHVKEGFADTSLTASTPNTQSKVVTANQSDKVAAEIAALPEGLLLDQSRDVAVYCATAAQIPSTLQEIGRLREVTFREVGEGTGKAVDLDRFDQHYLHLFAWHKQNREVIGAYRLGQTDKILRELGSEGLYTAELYHAANNVFSELNPALELGRSFVQRRYQKASNSLLMLWRGIAEFIYRNPHYRQLFGPVSISNEYSALAREVMVEYLRHHHRSPRVGLSFKARNPVSIEVSKELGIKEVIPHLKHLNDLNDLMADLHGEGVKVPVLLHLYLQLGAKFLACHLDPTFNYTITCLVVLDTLEIEPKRLGFFMGKEKMAEYLAHHNHGQKVA